MLQPFATSTFEKRMLAEGSQLSFAKTAKSSPSGKDPQATVASFGNPANTGADVSLMVNVLDAVTELPQASVAVHVMVLTLLQPLPEST